jgi:hypothetical protein
MQEQNLAAWAGTGFGLHDPWIAIPIIISRFIYYLVRPFIDTIAVLPCLAHG